MACTSVWAATPDTARIPTKTEIGNPERTALPVMLLNSKRTKETACSNAGIAVPPQSFVSAPLHVLVSSLQGFRYKIPRWLYISLFRRLIAARNDHAHCHQRSSRQEESSAREGSTVGTCCCVRCRGLEQNPPAHHRELGGPRAPAQTGQLCRRHAHPCARIRMLQTHSAAEQISLPRELFRLRQGVQAPRQTARREVQHRRVRVPTGEAARSHLH